MHALARRVLRTIRRHALVTAGDRLALAVSGGADSVAMASLVAELSAAGELDAEVAGVIHVNHGLRGDDSARDEVFCRELAARRGWPIDVGHFDVGRAATERRRSLESTARDIRYAFFTEAAARLGASRVATGHTVDDQAETVLLRLLRGSGTRGAGGIRVRRGPFVRPLLDCRRLDIRAYLTRIGEPFREDASNRDESIARNRVRHQLLPAIERIAPNGSLALARFASLAADDEDFLTQAAIEAASPVVLSNEAGVQVDSHLLKALPAALSRRVVRRMAEMVSLSAAPASRHLDAVRALAAADKLSGHLDLPGLTARRRGHVVTLAASVGRSPADGVAGARFEHPLPLPGSARVREVDLRIEASLAGAGSVAGNAGGGRGKEAAVQAASVTLPLAVRNRLPGDRLRPIGSPGRRKLQDVFVDRKVPRHERDRVPIVVDAAGRIVWVVGVTMAHECRITSPEESVVVLKAHHLEKGEE